MYILTYMYCNFEQMTVNSEEYLTLIYYLFEVRHEQERQKGRVSNKRHRCRKCDDNNSNGMAQYKINVHNIYIICI